MRQLLLSGLAAALLAATLPASATIDVNDKWDQDATDSSNEELNLFEVWNDLYLDDTVKASSDLRDYQRTLSDALDGVEFGSIITIEAITHWASFDHTAGWYSQDDNGDVTRHNLFTVSGPKARGYLADGNDPAWMKTFIYQDTFAGLFDYALDSQNTDDDGNNYYYEWYSDPTLNEIWWEDNPNNTNGHDPTQHLVIYEVVAGREYLLGWEDWPSIDSNGNPHSEYDGDYQDFMLRMFVGPVVPEPSSILLLGSGIAGLVTSRMLRRRRNDG